VKKREWKKAARAAEGRAFVLTGQVERLTKEVETMREHWRPIPIPHTYVPRDAACALCDDAPSHPRHQALTASDLGGPQV
jgi:hypothetical protein